MDKYEYKVRADEIKELIARGDYVQAAEIADTIDWRRVKSVMMLCTISDLYKINRRYEDARDMLLLAYERRPGGRTICYSLCELSIKMEEFVQAVEYYKEFVQVAPKDPGRFILQYKIYEAQDVGLEERIAVLEELKKRDYREKWAYELAYLYHRVGLATRCVEECDELILWFGEGKYVVKAMELKMLHEPLTAEQQDKYEHRFDSAAEEQEQAPAENGEQGDHDTPGYDDQSYGDAQLYEGQPYEGQLYDNAQGYEGQSYEGTPDYEGQPYAGADNGSQTYESVQDYPAESYDNAGDTKAYGAMHMQEMPVQPEEELDIHVKTVDVGQYNTINLQAELAAGLREVLGDDQKSIEEKPESLPQSEAAPMLDSDTESLDYPEIDEVDENDLEPENALEEMEGSEVFFGETGEIGSVQQADIFRAGKSEADTLQADAAGTDVSGGETIVREEKPVQPVTDVTAEIVMQELRRENLNEAVSQVVNAEPPKELANVLSQESDGQISLVMPDMESVEKQITGQMNIEDILAEWERMKKANEEKRKEEVRQRVLQQTGDMFTEFEASIRDGLLEQLESGKVSGDAVDELVENAVSSVGSKKENVESGQVNTEIPQERQDVPEEQYEEPQPDERTYEGASRDTALYGEEPAQENCEGGAEGDGFCGEEPAQENCEGRAEGDGFCGEEPVQENYEEEAEGDNFYREEPVQGNYEEEAEGDSFYGEEPVQGNYEEEAEGDNFYGEEPVQGNYEEEAEGDSFYGEEPIQENYEEEAEGDGFYGEEPARENCGALPDEDSYNPAAGENYASDEIADDEVEELEEIAEAGSDAENEGNVESAREEVHRDKVKVRALTREEKELFAPFVQSRSAREQLVNVIDNISMAAYTGNVIITGEEGMDTLTLAKNIVREMKMSDSNFSGKVAKISGQAFNQKNVADTIKNLSSGALIILKASGMTKVTAQELYRVLQKEQQGIVVILEDTRKAMDKLLAQNEQFKNCFTARMDVEAMSNDTLVAFGRQYAREMEYSIDELGILALHTRIEELQTIDHVVTVVEVKEIVDEAIRHANRKTIGHFFDILFAKRYDDEDMIILGEKDFA